MAIDAAWLRRAEALCCGSRPRDRIVCVDYLRDLPMTRESANAVFPFLDRLCLDPYDEVREDALALVGEYCASEPEMVWELVGRLAETASDEQLNELAVFVVEHLLEYHARTYIPKIGERLSACDTRWYKILNSCYLFGEAREMTSEVTDLLVWFEANCADL